MRNYAAEPLCRRRPVFVISAMPKGPGSISTAFLLIHNIRIDFLSGGLSLVIFDILLPCDVVYKSSL